MPCPFSPVPYALLGAYLARKLVPPHLQKALGPRGNIAVSISFATALGAAGVMFMRWLSRRSLKAEQKTTSKKALPLPVGLDLERFGLTERGFVPRNGEVCKRLPAAFSAWEAVGDEMAALTKSKEIRARVDAWELVSLEELGSAAEGFSPELRRAHTLLALIANCYVWCDESDPRSSLPAALAIPLHAASSRLGMNPVISHAVCDLWNWRCLDDRHFSQDSFRCLHTMTGTKDEEWFYCTSTAIQAIGGPLVLSSYDIFAEAVPQRDFKAVLGFLEDVSARLKQMTGVLQRASEHVSPQVFYNDMRPLLQGFGKGTKIPQGLVYEGVKEYRNKPQTFGGASAGQSSCIPLLDRILGVQHTGDAKGFTTDMLNYMPARHREYLQLFFSQPSLPDVIIKWSEQAVDTTRLNLIILEFNTCIDRMVEFRRGHWKLVGTHIIAAKAQLENSQGGCVVGPGAETGTGGSPLNSFLNSTIEATLAAKIQLG